jgi:hypothetical protein
MEDSLKELELLVNSADYEYSYLLSKLDYALAKGKYAEENLTLRRSEYELELAFDLGYAMVEKTEAEMEIMRVKYEIMLFLAQLYSLVGLGSSQRANMKTGRTGMRERGQPIFPLRRS